MRLAFTTNNSSRTPVAVAERLSAMGVPAAPQDVVSSAQSAATLLTERLPAGARVLVVGGQGLREAVVSAGLRVVAVAEEADAVVQGAHLQVAYGELAEAALAVGRGVLWVGTNSDATLPTPRGLMPGNGALLAVVATTTGATPLLAGKPELPLHAEAVTRTGARTPLVVGDRLDTDVEGAVRAGAPSLLVLTGVVDAAGLLAAPPGRRPSYLAADLGGLARPARGVDVAGEVDGVRRGTETTPDGAADPDGWIWEVGAHVATVAQRGGPPRRGADEEDRATRSLRVLAAAVWAAVDAGVGVDLDAALARWRTADR